MTEPDEEDDYGCGWEYDHDTVWLDKEDGHWLCSECGAEGWDDDE